jgi:hypothetical protein
MKVKLARSRILRKQQTFPRRLIDARCHRSELDRFHGRKTGHVSTEIKRSKIFEFGRHTVTTNRTFRHLLNFTSLKFFPPRNGLSLVQANVSALGTRTRLRNAHPSCATPSPEKLVTGREQF